MKAKLVRRTRAGDLGCPRRRRAPRTRAAPSTRSSRTLPTAPSTATGRQRRSTRLWRFIQNNPDLPAVQRRRAGPRGLPGESPARRASRVRPAACSFTGGELILLLGRRHGLMGSGLTLRRGAPDPLASTRFGEGRRSPETGALRRSPRRQQAVGLRHDDGDVGRRSRRRAIDACGRPAQVVGETQRGLRPRSAAEAHDAADAGVAGPSPDSTSAGRYPIAASRRASRRSRPSPVPPTTTISRLPRCEVVDTRCRVARSRGAKNRGATARTRHSPASRASSESVRRGGADVGARRWFQPVAGPATHGKPTDLRGSARI